MDANGGNSEWAQLAIQMDNLTEHQYIRKHILEYAGISDQEKVNYEEEKSLIYSQMEPIFQLCRNRILMGRFRYGSNTGKTHFNCLPSVKKKIKLYETTGNTEHLIDAINYLYLEFRFGTNPRKHFSPTDDENHASPKHKY